MRSKVPASTSGKRSSRNLSAMAANSRGGWLNQMADSLGLAKKKPAARQPASRKKPSNFDKLVASQRKKIKQLKKAGNDKAAEQAERRLAGYLKRFEPDQPKRQPKPEVAVAVAPMDTSQVVKSAYLRTLSRLPSEEELSRSRKYLEEADDPMTGAKVLLWALLNTKEFIVNH